MSICLFTSIQVNVEILQLRAKFKSLLQSLEFVIQVNLKHDTITMQVNVLKLFAQRYMDKAEVIQSYNYIKIVLVNSEKIFLWIIDFLGILKNFFNSKKANVFKGIACSTALLFPLSLIHLCKHQFHEANIQQNCSTNQYHKVRIKRIAIAKCDLFFHYGHAKEISLYYFCDIKLCKTQKNTGEFNLYCWDHVCRVNEWCLVDCFHWEFTGFSQIIVRD